MEGSDKLPLLKQSMKLLVNRLDERDHVAIVTYSSSAGICLESTSCSDKAKVLAAIDALAAGGSTNGGAGIQMAYEQCAKNFDAEGLNRVLLATDGDFNVGITDQNELVHLIEEKAQGKAFLSVLGFGTGNLKDDTLEKLADHGNGHYAYVDSLPEGDTSTELKFRVNDGGKRYSEASGDLKFAASVAAFGMLLRGSPHRGSASYDSVLELAGEGLEHDPKGRRIEFLDLVRRAKSLSGR